ncbi:MAG: tetratricopeptide repeat protein [Chloroflexi bacterium]|nr:tetratricopeptide repeat protein [Chloroflexota bacterium]
MYLRTPKRYRAKRRRELRLFSGRKLLVLLAIPLVVYGGWLIWQNQGKVRSSVIPQLEQLAADVQTQVAPAPTPTATPDVISAQTNCDNALRQGNIPDAIDLCRVLAEASPNDVQRFYDVTYLLIVTSNYGQDAAQMAEALDFAEKAVNANPESAYGWAIRALALDWSGNYGPALASALHAKALDETFAPAYSFLGEIYQDLGKFDVAESYLKQALERDTQGIIIAHTFRNLGYLYSRQGFYEDSLQPYQAAMQNAPNYTYIAVELAGNYLALQEVDKAIDVLVAALEKNPNDPLVLVTLGSTYWRNGSVERAREYYSRCLDVDRDNARCLSRLGRLQFSDGDYATAATNLERAVSLGSDESQDYYYLGYSYSAMGRCEKAIPYLQQGHQMAVESDDQQSQVEFVTQLQSCGILVNTRPETETGSAQ